MHAFVLFCFEGCISNPAVSSLILGQSQSGALSQLIREAAACVDLIWKQGKSSFGTPTKISKNGCKIWWGILREISRERVGLSSKRSVKFRQSGLSLKWSITFHVLVFHLVGLIKFHHGGLCSGVPVHCQAGIQCKRWNDKMYRDACRCRDMSVVCGETCVWLTQCLLAVSRLYVDTGCGFLQ